MPQAFDPFERPEFLSQTWRARDIERLTRIYNGTQYEGRPNWWTGCARAGGDAVPLRERKPCIIYKLPRAAVNQVALFLFGEERFPRVTAEASVSEEEQGKDGKPPKEPQKPEFGYPAIDDEQAEQLSDWFADLIDTAQVKSLMGALAKTAISRKTAVVVAGIEDGEFKFELPQPQHCAAKFKGDDPRNEVLHLLWVYEFAKEVTDEKGEPCCKRYLFRREWDTRNVHVYEDVEVKPGQDVKWGTPKSTEHGLSFCPVRWIRNEGEHSSDVDGTSLIADQAEEFEALDMALSRRHQGIIYLGAPQIVETGVEEGDGPAQDGRKAVTPGYSAAQGATYKQAPKARRIAPDNVWTYEGEKVTVEMVETTGKAFEAGTHHVTDIRSRLLESMSVVLTSMTDTIGRGSQSAGRQAEMSGRFLLLAHAPLVALTQEYRDHWWPNVLRPLLSMLARMVTEVMALDAAGEPVNPVYIPGTQAVFPLLQLFKVSEEKDDAGNVTKEGGWIEPQLTASWGQFFSPDMDERKVAVEASIEARDGKLITEETAAGMVGPMWGVENVQKELQEIEEAKVDEPAPGFNDASDEMTRLHDTLVPTLEDDAEPGPTGRTPTRGNPQPDASPGGSADGGAAGNPRKRRRPRRSRRK